MPASDSLMTQRWHHEVIESSQGLLASRQSRSGLSESHVLERLIVWRSERPALLFASSVEFDEVDFDGLLLSRKIDAQDADRLIRWNVD